MKIAREKRRVLNRIKKKSILANISPDFKPNLYDAEVARLLIKVEGTPMAVRLFDTFSDRLTDYAYWFFLSTIWVKYTGYSDLQLWKRLFASSRPKRETSIMKPDELAAYRALPETVIAYRAHRKDEVDWISFTTEREKAEKFLKMRPGGYIGKYQVPQKDIIAYFLRRGESELLVIDRSRIIDEHKVLWHCGNSYGHIENYADCMECFGRNIDATD